VPALLQPWPQFATRTMIAGRRPPWA